MPHSFFLSHFNEDKGIADIIARTLERVSMRQISPWYSSDNKENGGLFPGNIWFTEISNKIRQSGALVAILTPNSIGKPWIYFECGIAQALGNCEIIPICFGVKKEDISLPLGMYQCYQVSDYRSLKEFIGKVLVRFSLVFDEEMVQPVLEHALTSLSKIEFSDKSPELSNTHFSQIALDIKNHIDKRFLGLMEQRPTDFAKQDDPEINVPDTDNFLSYSVTINITFPKYKGGKKFVEVRKEDAVQDVLDSIFFLISNYVGPYTYLEHWILRNCSTGERMIMYEVTEMVPASVIFRPNIEWEVIKLSEPYTASGN